MQHKPTLVDFVLLISISLIWGSSFLAIKIGLEVFEPFSLAATRVFIAGVFMFILARFRGEIFPTGKATLKLLALMGMFGSMAFVLINWGQQFTSSSTAGIMLAFGPLNLLFLAHFMTHDEKLTLGKILGFGFGFIGVLALFWESGLTNFEANGLGITFLFFASIFYALSMIFVRKLKNLSSINIATGFLLMAALFVVPPSLIFDPPWSHELTPRVLVAVLFLGIGSSGISSLLLVTLVKRSGATFASYSNYLTPLVAVLWGTTLLGEKIAPLTWLGLVLILGGVGVASLVKPKKTLP